MNSEPLKFPDRSGIFERWLDSLRASNYSENTISTYRRVVDSLRASAGDDPGAWTRAVIGTWAKGLVARELTGASRALYFAGVRSFLGFCREEEIGDVLPASSTTKLLRVRRKDVVTGRRWKGLSPDDLAKFEKSILSADPRDAAAVSLMLYGGLRASEVSNLKSDQLNTDSQGNIILKVIGKGSKYRVVVIPAGPGSKAIEAWRAISGQSRASSAKDDHAPEISEIVARTLESSRAASPSTRFLGLSGSRQFANRAVERIASTAGVKVSPHGCRHSYAERMLDLTGDVTLVAQLLGHSSIATTQQYLDRGDGSVRAKMKRAGLIS